MLKIKFLKKPFDESLENAGWQGIAGSIKTKSRPKAANNGFWNRSHISKEAVTKQINSCFNYRLSEFNAENANLDITALGHSLLNLQLTAFAQQHIDITRKW
nr:hypothetical protein [Desulfobulbaceae bacterium]